MPSWLGILVYKLVTSNEARNAFLGKVRSFSGLIRCVSRR